MKQIEITVRLDEINSAKNNMFEEIKNTGINLTEEKDVKKAYELILNKYFNIQLILLNFQHPEMRTLLYLYYIPLLYISLL